MCENVLALGKSYTHNQQSLNKQITHFCFSLILINYHNITAIRQVIRENIESECFFISEMCEAPKLKCCCRH